MSLTSRVARRLIIASSMGDARAINDAHRFYSSSATSKKDTIGNAAADNTADDADKPAAADAPPPSETKMPPTEVGGPRGPEPTRYGDWERKGRVSDF